MRFCEQLNEYITRLDCRARSWRRPPGYPHRP